MTFETAFTFFNTIVLGGWAGFGMICGLQWWQERKERAEDSRAFRKAVHQVSVNHLNAAKAEAWKEGYQDGKNDQVRASTIEHGIDKPSTNPYKENN